MPPPGFYVLEYGNVYNATTLKDGNGNDVPLAGFKVNALVAATRLVWSTPTMVMGGNLVFHSILPVVDLEVSAGKSEHKTGLGDILTKIDPQGRVRFSVEYATEVLGTAPDATAGQSKLYTAASARLMLHELAARLESIADQWEF